MPIPTQFDHALGNIEALASGVVAQLRILRHTPDTDARVLRERLQDFCDKVLDAADEIIASREVIHDR